MGVVGCGKGVVYLASSGRPTDIGLAGKGSVCSGGGGGGG